MLGGFMQFKYDTAVGAMFGGERHRTVTTAEPFMLMNRAHDLVKTGRYSFFDDTEQTSMAGVGIADSRNLPTVPITGR